VRFQLRTQAVTLGHGLVVLRARHQLLADQRLQAAGFGGGLLLLCLQPGHLAARGLQLRGIQAALRIGIDRIQGGHHLAGFDPHAFLDHHLAHLAGDLGRDRGHAPGDHVATGIEHRTAGAALLDGHRGRGFHLHGRRAAEQEATAAAISSTTTMIAIHSQRRPPPLPPPPEAGGGDLRSIRSSFNSSAEAFIRSITGVRAGVAGSADGGGSGGGACGTA
jgi:hypothetical protein